MAAFGKMRSFVAIEGLESRQFFSAAPIPHALQAPQSPSSPAKSIVQPSIKHKAPPGGANALLVYSGTYETESGNMRLLVLLRHASDGGLVGTFRIYANGKRQTCKQVHFKGSDGTMSFAQTDAANSTTLNGTANPDWTTLSGGLYIAPAKGGPGVGVPFTLTRTLLIG